MFLDSNLEVWSRFKMVKTVCQSNRRFSSVPCVQFFSSICEQNIFLFLCITVGFICVIFINEVLFNFKENALNTEYLRRIWFRWCWGFPRGVNKG